MIAKRKTVILVLLSWLIWPCRSHAFFQVENIGITQTQFQIPVLLKKQENAVLKIKVHVPQRDAVTVANEFYLSSQGSTNLTAVKQVRLYYMGADSTNTNFNKPVHTRLFGYADKLEKSITINGNKVLSSGNHYFWVSIELNERSKLTDVISCSVVDVKLGDRKVKALPIEKPIHQRIGVALRQQGEDGIHTYRIPGVTTSNKGTLLATCDGRRDRNRDLQGNIDIILNRSTNGGRTWEPLQVAMDRGEWGNLPKKFNGISDACILNDEKTGTIYIAGLWMYGVINSEGKWIEGLTSSSQDWNHQWRDKGSGPGFDVKQTSQFLIVKSTDDGKTWSEPVNLTTMCKKEEWWLWAPAPGHGVTLRDGTLVFPTQGRDKNGRPFSNITYSKDAGLTWKTSNPADTGSTTECMVVELGDGSLMLNMRANENKRRAGNDNGRAIAITNTLGESWEQHSSSRNALQESTCMASIHKHNYVEAGVKKSVLIFCNPNTKQGRHHITLKLSFDDGKTWPEKYFTLLDEWSGNGYSCITSVSADTIGVVYESSQSDIVYQSFSLRELMKK